MPGYRARSSAAIHRTYSRRLVFTALLGSVGLVLLGCGGGGTGPSKHPGPSSATKIPQKTGGRPNIVFVLTDDLSTNLVQYMPHVAALEKSGMSFSNYTVTDSLCCPSRASIFSGKFPHDTGVFTNKGRDGGFFAFHRRGEEKHTFATALQAAGYRTAMMGKYLNRYEPQTKLGGPRPYVPPGWNVWDVAGWGYPEYGYRLNENHHVAYYGHSPKDYLTDVLSQKATRFIRSSAKGQKPFMLEVATFAPHFPYTPAPSDAKTFPGLSAPEDPAFDRMPTDPPSWLTRHPPLTRHKINRINAAFRLRVQAVQSVDRMIGSIESTLHSTGLGRDTYIVFSSDNGLHMGEYRLMPGKLTAFDTDVRVPLVVSGPGIPAGRTSAAIVQNIDLCPTFEALGGATTPGSVDGHSLVPLLRGRHVPHWRTTALIEHRGPDYFRGDPDYQGRGSGNPPTYEAIRTSTFTYVLYRNGQQEYYNRLGDPYELHNIVSTLSPSHTSLLKRDLLALQHCHGERECWAAGHPKL